MTFEAMTPHEERANTVAHGVGFIASAIGSSILLARALNDGDGWQLASVIVYSLSLLLLYAASTCYHGTQPSAAKALLERFDHSAIYLLIAGTYTPFLLISLRGAWGWSLFGVIWGLALVGILLKLRFIGRFPRLSTATYIAMGWLVLIAARPMVQALPLVTVILLVAGGVVYTAGTFFYHNQRIPYSHTIWHIFVLAGSACHFLAVSTQVVP